MSSQQLPIFCYQSPGFKKRLRRRYMIERCFHLCGLIAIGLSLTMLGILLISITLKGYTAFQQAKVKLPITFDVAIIDRDHTQDPEIYAQADYKALMYQALDVIFPQVQERDDKRQLYRLLSVWASFPLKERVLNTPEVIGTTEEIWFLLDDDVDQFLKGYGSCGVSFQERRTGQTCSIPESQRRLSDTQIGWIDTLLSNGRIDLSFNMSFFTGGDSREPEQAGILGSLVGSFFTLLVCLLGSLPIGVASAIYLEEFAPKNAITKMIEVITANLMAVPSIVFGLLGLAIFINFFSLPRSVPLVGGLVLALMTLPMIIIVTRSALRAVPLSIRDAALGLGASTQQMVFHHVLPLSSPGILTGSIIGMAQALGETAPLLMIGMVAFIVDIPYSFLEPSTTLPVQIYIWSDSPERGFVERTAGAIMVLLAFMMMMNGLAIYLRHKFERRW